MSYILVSDNDSEDGCQGSVHQPEIQTADSHVYPNV